jgi:putative transposase
MPNDHEKTRRDWRIPDELWERIAPLLPPRQPHPLGGYRPRVDDRKTMDAIFFVLRTGCQWHALHKTKICSSSSAHRRFQEWVAADVFVALWEQGLVEDDALPGIDWGWLAMDGAMTKAPLGGKREASPPRTAASSAPNAASSPTAVACRSVWPWTARIGRMSS